MKESEEFAYNLQESLPARSKRSRSRLFSNSNFFNKLRILFAVHKVRILILSIIIVFLLFFTDLGSLLPFGSGGYISGSVFGSGFHGTHGLPGTPKWVSQPGIGEGPGTSVLKKKKGNIVIMLAANEDGGVNKWKGTQEWSIERSSIANKKAYAKRHGYQLAIKDLTAKKRYSHEWRESWEKVDVIRQTMRQFPEAEWFWWLDLHTLIMEPQISLESHFLNNLEQETYRNIEHFNPLNIAPVIDNVDYSQPVDLIITQDCGGFNLGSFLIRRSEWTDALLDIWWDPVFYEQKHMQWEHKEQDALETLYSTQGWIRSRVAFLPLRKLNALPAGACTGEYADDTRLFYNANQRDFLVNMGGCQWGRNCWDEMEQYKALSKNLHEKKHWWQIF